ncbi:hypothetical protein [Variovorax guangxiensis]|uniref:hypothetical protein n=1 Tax=Variovorax guangxiensis TaxID=1775474 RepID=UPI002862E336|nr:hypothetical protein [Variovorax guangxiensis]MDR6859134.1 hypothetical protein [Variovorax guangxiensis]
MDLHHPLFQAFALPLVVAFMVTGMLRGALGPVQGRRWAAAGVALAIVGSAAWILGWRLPPGSLTERLPWIYAIVALAGLGLEAVHAGRRTEWLTASILWALALASLAAQALPLMIGLWVLGTAVIRAVLREHAARANAAAILVVASLGLAAIAMTSGSALLFELSLALAAAVAGCALWLWPFVRIAFGAAGALVSTLAWLALTLATALLTEVRPLTLLLLAGAFTAGPLVHWGRRRLQRAAPPPSASARTWVEPLIVAAVAAAWVAAALAFAQWGDTGTPDAAMDDPYYKPRW